MTSKEYAWLLDMVKKYFSHVTNKNGKKIKYISSNFDTRDGSIYYITMREWFNKDSKEFSHDDCTLDNITKWLGETK